MSNKYNAVSRFRLSNWLKWLAPLDSALPQATVCDAQQRGLITKPKWYERVEVLNRGSGAGFQITLDGRPVRTPGKNPVVLPNKQLALAVAAEWQWQETGKLRPQSMPLMSLAATVLDQPKPRAAVIQTLLSFLETDAVCCRNASGPVADIQNKALGPILDLAQRHLGASFSVSDSIFGCSQSEAAEEAVQKHLDGLDPWRLAVTDALSGVCRSVLMGIAITQGWMSMGEALTAAQIEEQFQIDGWGMVEGGHDIDAADVRVRIAAPSVFVRLLTQV